MKNAEKIVKAQSKKELDTKRVEKLEIHKPNLAKLTNDLEHEVDTTGIRLQWILIPVFASLTGYSEKAVRRKIEDGVWLESKHFKKAPDGRITMDLQEYYKWVAQS